MMRRGGGELTGVILVLILLGAAYYLFAYQPGSNLISVDVTLYYTDGTSRAYTLKAPILGQAIVDTSNGKVLTNIAWAVKASPVWSGNAAKFEASGANSLYLIVGSASPVGWAYYPIAYSTTTGLGTLGANTFTVYQGNLAASVLESWDFSQLNPTKTLRFLIGVTGKLTMIDPNILPTSTQKEGQVDFQYRVDPDGLKSLSISITVTPT